MHETAAYLTLEDLSRFNVEVGQPLRKTTRSVPGEIVMTRPDGARDTDFDAPTELEYGEYVLRPYARTALPGFYTLEMTYPLTGSGGVAGGRVAEQFAVNLDIAEAEAKP